MVIGIVITSFKDDTLVLRCVDSILAAENAETEIIVVDCLSENLPRICKERYGDKIHLIHLNHDVGVAEQRNIGFRYSANIGDYTLFLDNDTEIRGKALSELIKALRHSPKYSIFQPKIINCNEGKNRLEMGLSSNIFGIPKPIGDSNSTPFFVSGSAMLFKNEMLKEIGGFDSVLQFGAEELDLTWRARLMGYDIETVSEAEVCHRTQGTRSRVSSERLHLGLRNTIRMLLKNYSSPINLILVALLILKSGIESVIFVIAYRIAKSFEGNVASLAASKNSFPELILAFVRAIAWNLIRMKDTIKHHNRIQANRVIRDKEIIRSMRKSDLIFLSPAYKKN